MYFRRVSIVVIKLKKVNSKIIIMVLTWFEIISFLQFFYKVYEQDIVLGDYLSEQRR
jgi:hypothetical protein